MMFLATLWAPHREPDDRHESVPQPAILGGACRYTDMREALPGVATNLLASRLRQLVTRGLAEQVDVPPRWPVLGTG